MVGTWKNASSFWLLSAICESSSDGHQENAEWLVSSDVYFAAKIIAENKTKQDKTVEDDLRASAANETKARKAKVVNVHGPMASKSDEKDMTETTPESKTTKVTLTGEEVFAAITFQRPFWLR